MHKSKYFFPAILVAGASLFSGCFDPGTATDAPAQEGSASATPASIKIAATWVLGGNPGDIVAFTGISPSNSGWALDAAYTPKPEGGHALRRFSGGTSTIVPGGLTDLDIVGNNEIWGVNDIGGVFKNSSPINADGGTWVQLKTPAPARRIATGANGAAYILSTTTVYGGYTLYKYSGSGTEASSWQLISAGLIEIDVDNNGDLWGVNVLGEAFCLPLGNPNGKWQRKSSSVNEVNIAAGAGNIYIMTTKRVYGGYALKKWNGAAFVDIDGGLMDIQVDAGGRLWGANEVHDILRYVP
ncbi:MAG: tectonin domain-containing protein [Fibrobacteria bacterium]